MCSTPMAIAQVESAGYENIDGGFASNSVEVEVNDPFENFNRKMLAFNDKAFQYVLSPIVKVYNTIIPKKVQEHVNNVYVNAQMPGRFFNNAFQGKFKNSGIALGRFVVNSTVGVAGLFNPASDAFDWDLQDEDFGQTLGHYGMGEGTYFMLPLLGPTTTRDIFGAVGNMALNPFFWIGYHEVDPEDAFLVSRITNGVNGFAYNVHDPIVKMNERSIEPYASLRDAYVKMRRSKIEK